MRNCTVFCSSQVFENQGIFYTYSPFRFRWPCFKCSAATCYMASGLCVEHRPGHFHHPRKFSCSACACPLRALVPRGSHCSDFYHQRLGLAVLGLCIKGLKPFCALVFGVFYSACYFWDPCCCMYEWFVPFCCWVICHCMHMPCVFIRHRSTFGFE